MIGAIMVVSGQCHRKHHLSGFGIRWAMHQPREAVKRTILFALRPQALADARLPCLGGSAQACSMNGQRAALVRAHGLGPRAARA